MSKTPKTDAQSLGLIRLFPHTLCKNEAVLASFARELERELADTKEILREIAYPRRGTVECEKTIQDYANYIQANYTLEELETIP
jgi:hypothetical protein